jgi:hypothetical protein
MSSNRRTSTTSSTVVVLAALVVLALLVALQAGIISRQLLSRNVHATQSVFFCLFKESPGGKNCLLSTKKPLTIHERHQIAINELEIGAVGTNLLSMRKSRWAREDPGRARTWKSMNN